MAEEHAGLFSIPRVPSSARLSSELGTREEEKMMATKSLYCWTPVNPLSLSSGNCREWHSLFVVYCVFSVYWVTSPREPTDFLVHVNAPPSAGLWIDTWWHVQLPSETCCHPQMSPLRQSLVVDPAETLFHIICLLTTPTGQVAVFPFEERSCGWAMECHFLSTYREPSLRQDVHRHWFADFTQQLTREAKAILTSSLKMKKWNLGDSK